MAGAIAGTALINYAPQTSKRLSTITLTINNLCNLECPHCYLQYKGEECNYVDQSVLQHIYQADFNHLVIVGKEPFVNKRSADLVEEIATNIKSQGKTIGIITNGLGLDKLTSSMAANLSYIDISFDGGELTYEKYRKGNFANLISKINAASVKFNFKSFNALHVVNNVTIHNIDDMLRVKKYFPFKNIMFSPYIETMNDGINYVKKIKIEQVLSTFAKNNNFLSTQEAFILLDVYHLVGDLQSIPTYSEFNDVPNIDFVKDIISEYNLESKIKLIEKDPIHHGFVRLTYDGFLLSPYASLNPKEYQKEGKRIEEISLNNFFETKLKSRMQLA